MDLSVLTNIIVTGLIAIAMAGAGYVASLLVARILTPIAHRFLDHGMAGFVVSLARVGVLLFTLKLIVDQTGAAGVLVILVTAFTGAFALGSERIASDIVAGANLFLLRYYKVGDLVTIGSLRGRISAISLTHTSMGNDERDRIIIPNAEILGQTIVNHSSLPGARLSALVPVDGRHERGAAMERLLEIARGFEPQLRGPGDDPRVILREVIGGGAQSRSIYEVSIYVPEELYGANSMLLYHLNTVLDAEGLRLEHAVNG
jgi:small conductance mechanosensitive channel